MTINPLTEKLITLAQAAKLPWLPRLRGRLGRLSKRVENLTSRTTGSMSTASPARPAPTRRRQRSPPRKTPSPRPNKLRRTFGEKYWAKPLQWEKVAAKEGKAKRVFCSSMCDVFEDHPTIDAEREKLWLLIEQTPHLHWQLLTKRPERIAVNLPEVWDAIKGRVWIGTSVENADYVGRVDHIRGIDAAVRFISYEPALGPIAHAVNLTNIDWLIYGGESGANFRPEDKQWARDVVALCRTTGTAFFHKQSAHRFTEHGIELDGQVVREYPTPRRFALSVVNSAEERNDV